MGPGNPEWKPTHDIKVLADGLPLLGSDASADFETTLTLGDEAPEKPSEAA